ncbi:alcohol dehydrogenase catalytic domain-containing protein [Sphingomonas sp. KR3-1]|uniref:alcohol dehydrogenase catalytic domain-containing protein n=1 Tax=Sphingomonas sp. KR3-1 TaxID=3156611 RepID=UPI0032B56845
MRDFWPELRAASHRSTRRTVYPFVLGSDVAGEVAEVGAGVTRFAVGDRVVGHAVGSDKARNCAAEGAFQSHVVLLAHMTAPPPDDLAFEAAAVLPLAASTAACGLFQRDLRRVFPGAGAARGGAAPRALARDRVLRRTIA